MEYKCDRCFSAFIIDQKSIHNKQHYIEPHGCFGGDYYADQYYYTSCKCGRAIKVNESDIKDKLSVPKDYTPHYGVCTLNEI